MNSFGFNNAKKNTKNGNAAGPTGSTLAVL